MHELSSEELEKVAAGNDGISNGLRPRTVAGLEKGYLAIRMKPAYNDANILGTLYNNNVVFSTECYDGNYVLVYANCPRDPYYGIGPFSGYGWVNKNYLAR